MHAGLPVQHAFHVLRENVQTLWRHDYFLLAAKDYQFTVLLERPDIAGMEPTVFEGLRCFFGAAEIARRHILASHQNLAVGADLYLHACDRLAPRPLARMERMVEGHNGRGFGQSVALNYQKSELGEKCLEIG